MQSNSTKSDDSPRSPPFMILKRFIQSFWNPKPEWTTAIGLQHIITVLFRTPSKGGLTIVSVTNDCTLLCRAKSKMRYVWWIILEGYRWMLLDYWVWMWIYILMDVNDMRQAIEPWTNLTRRDKQLRLVVYFERLGYLGLAPATLDFVGEFAPSTTKDCYYGRNVNSTKNDEYKTRRD